MEGDEARDFVIESLLHARTALRPMDESRVNEPGADPAEINGDTSRIGTFTTQHRNTITVVDDTGRRRVTIRHT